MNHITTFEFLWCR